MLGPAAASASRAPGSDRANAISMPRAVIVTSSDDTPAEISGNGTPVMGSTPSTAPMFTSAWAMIHSVIAPAASRENVSGTRRAMRSPAKARPVYKNTTHSVPSSPSSSPRIENTKSVGAAGTQPHLDLLAPRPTPNQPPEPSAYLPSRS